MNFSYVSFPTWGSQSHLSVNGICCISWSLGTPVWVPIEKGEKALSLLPYLLSTENTQKKVQILCQSVGLWPICSQHMNKLPIPKMLLSNENFISPSITSFLIHSTPLLILFEVCLGLAIYFPSFWFILWANNILGITWIFLLIVMRKLCFK